MDERSTPLAGGEQRPPHPIVVRLLQVLVALIVLGLAAYGIYSAVLQASGS